MNLRGRIPVEQLDDERMTNIERKLVVAVSDLRAPTAHASRRLVAVAAAALAIGTAGIVGYKLHRTPAAVPDAPQQLALHGGTLDLGDAQLTSTAATDATIERTPTRTVVQMRRGTLDFAVTHDPRRVFVVRAGDTEIEDIGTKFRVAFDGQTSVAVTVTEGEVRVVHAGSSANLTAGHRWSTSGGAAAVVALADGPIASPGPARDRPSDPAASGDATPGEASSSSGASPSSRTAAVPTAPTSSSSSPSSTSALPSSTKAASQAPRGKHARSNARIALEKLAIEEPLDVGATDTNTAIAKYLELAVSMRDAQDKTQVLYSMAVVQHRAHQDKAALYSLSGVVKRQGGKAYRAALWLNVRIECMQQFDEECRQAADLYLRKVPDGPAAGIAQAILDEIQRG